MKKFFLTGSVLLAFAAASYAQSAQNTSTINQNGNEQSAVTSQVGNSFKSNIQQTSDEKTTNKGNYAETNQLLGQSSEAYINQLGSKSGYVIVRQEAGYDGANTATVNQKNNSGGDGTLPGAKATPEEVTKAGGNYTFVYQNGSNQQTTVNQNDESAGNSAVVADQANYGYSQTIKIDQNNKSKNNTAKAVQAGDFNNLSISQSNNATGNKADVLQGRSTYYGGPNSFFATATVEQNGSSGGSMSVNNEATIKQQGIWGGTAIIRQNASSANGSDYSRSNKGTITQTDNDNYASIDQSNKSLNNNATIQQDAYNGSATVSQSSESAANIAKINQISGSGLQVRVLQDNALENTATTNQYGTNNRIIVAQTEIAKQNEATINQGSDNTNSANNTVSTIQTGGSQYGKITVTQNGTKDGSDNQALIEQVGSKDGKTKSDYNKATLSQEGSRNATSLLQTGEGNNTAQISQTGNNNIVQGVSSAMPGIHTMSVSNNFATQDGSKNTMTVSQTSPDGMNSNIFNTANLFQSGTGNMLDLNQTATTVSNVSTISQTGTSNMASVTQLGNGTSLK